MPSKFLNISVDSTLGGASPSDEVVVSQKAIKDYVDSHSSNVDIDNSTITTNSSDQLQSVGLINKNTAPGATSPIYDWVGTYAEYTTQNIATTHPEWVCFITDDSTGGELKANTNLDNLTEDGKNISTWSTNVTNCITEIPQDIKLELNAGVLTLKAGSKVYVPNGSGTFVEYVVPSDLSSTYTQGTTTQVFLFFDYDSLSNFRIRLVSETFSGPTAPSSEQYMVWYDTTNNIIKFSNDAGSTWTRQYSFPVCVATVGSSGFTSVNRVFNGLGRIGQSAFSLPGIKGLIPNGRNADGTLKNIEFTTTNVYVDATFSLGYIVNNQVVAINSTGILWQNWIGEYDHEPAVVQYAAYYNSTTNKMYFAYSATEWTELDRAVAGFFSTTTGGVITNLNTRQSFHAVDYNDTEYMAHQAMPSKKFMALTLGASGTQYTAPADGYVYFAKQSTSAYQYVNISCNNMSSFEWAFATDIGIFVWLPVKKGDIFTVDYNLGGPMSSFRFVYAQGAQ